MPLLPKVPSLAFWRLSSLSCESYKMGGQSGLSTLLCHGHEDHLAGLLVSTSSAQRIKT